MTRRRKPALVQRPRLNRAALWMHVFAYEYDRESHGPTVGATLASACARNAAAIADEVVGIILAAPRKAKP